MSLKVQVDLRDENKRSIACVEIPVRVVDAA